MNPAYYLWIKDVLGMGGVLLLWTFIIYWMHRLAHIHHPRNPLWQLHRAHHAIGYLSAPSQSTWPRFGQFLLWLGSWRASLDVIVSMTIPAIVIAIIIPRYGVPLLIFHYFYELFCSEYALDHNPNIQGGITRVFAWGDFHLLHHMTPRNNFCLIITLWDRVFRTAVDPVPGTAARRRKSVLEQKANQL